MNLPQRLRIPHQSILELTQGGEQVGSSPRSITILVDSFMIHTASPKREVFALPIADKVLIYAPLHNLAALLDSRATEQLRKSLIEETPAANAKLSALGDSLLAPSSPVPQPRQGGMGTPLFLGLVPTRGCNMSCAYCDFAAPKSSSRVMDLVTARRAVDSYLDILARQNASHAELHLFGGEPFFAPEVVHFAVEYALARAAERGFSIHFEAITNGFFNQRVASWVASTFDTIFLSLDGPREIQDRYRSGLNGRSAYDVVSRNARLLAEHGVELILRSCITSETVDRIPEIAAWFAEEFHPTAVCFETLVPSDLSQSNSLQPPDPWSFARGFGQAAELLARQGIQTVLSTADLNYPHLSFCPIGTDAMIVTPDGLVHACYLLEENWQQEGLDLTYGHLEEDAPGGLSLDLAALENIRQLNMQNYPLCADCFCRFSCSGGCHVNRRAVLYQNEYDATCIQTRLISASVLLDRLGQGDLGRQWLSDPTLHQPAVLSRGDRL
jgi:uncharacterized protein